MSFVYNYLNIFFLQNAGSVRIFGGSLENLLKGGEKIPVIVERLIKAIEIQGLFVEGLYRKSGAAPKARELRSQIETGNELYIPLLHKVRKLCNQ